MLSKMIAIARVARRRLRKLAVGRNPAIASLVSSGNLLKQSVAGLSRQKMPSVSFSGILLPDLVSSCTLGTLVGSVLANIEDGLPMWH